MNENNKKFIKIIKNLKPNKKKHAVFMVSLVLIFLFGIFSIEHYYNNYLAYETLSDIRDEVNLSHYKDNNYLVKDSTLTNMKQEVDQRVTGLIEIYEENITNTKELDNALQEVASTTSSDLSTYGEIENIIREDLIQKIELKEENIENIEIDLEDLEEEESQRYNELTQKKEVDTSSQDLEDLYKIYDTQVSIEEDMKDLSNTINERKIKEAEEEAEAKAQELAEQEAEEEAEENLDFSGLESSLVADGNFNRAVGENLFNAVNAYRAHLGLVPFSYNSSMQSCVDQESQAYGTNGNPHNWICPVSNENASNAPVGSDAVQISMDFFMTDPPHEAVLSGNYTSATTSVYENGGTSYIILAVF